MRYLCTGNFLPSTQSAACATQSDYSQILLVSMITKVTLFPVVPQLSGILPKHKQTTRGANAHTTHIENLKRKIEKKKRSVLSLYTRHAKHIVLDLNVSGNHAPFKLVRTGIYENNF